MMKPAEKLTISSSSEPSRNGKDGTFLCCSLYLYFKHWA